MLAIEVKPKPRSIRPGDCVMIDSPSKHVYPKQVLVKKVGQGRIEGEDADEHRYVWDVVEHGGSIIHVEWLLKPGDVVRYTPESGEVVVCIETVDNLGDQWLPIYSVTGPCRVNGKEEKGVRTIHLPLGGKNWFPV